MRRMGSIFLVAALAVTAAGVVAVPAAQALGGSITGVVRDSSGVPIAGATVFAQSQPNMFYYPTYSAVSDAFGNYAISGLPPGAWKVVGFASGFSIRWGNAPTFETGTAIDVVADESHSFDLTLLRKTASISGTVTYPDGSPAVGVSVSTFSQSSPVPYFIPGFELSGYSGFADTDASGHYAITGLAPAIFTVSFSSFPNSGPPPAGNLYLSEQYLNSHDPLTAMPLQLVEGTQTSGIDAELDLGATISGRITDPDGNPAVGALVSSPASIDTGGAITDVDGRYTLVGIPPGDVTYVMAQPADPLALPGWYGGANFETATHIPVTLGQVIDGVDIQLPASGVVNVAVFRPDGSVAPSTFVPCIAPGVPEIVPFPIPGWGPTVHCTSGGQVNILTSGAIRIPVGTYNALSGEGFGAFQVTSVNPSAITTFTLTANASIDCTFHLGGSASCAPTDPATLDGDGVAAVVEDGAPNNGDGNGDGVRDATQGNVTSLPAAIGGGYVTLVVADPLHITSARVSAPQVTQPAETGTIGVNVAGLVVGSTADVTILRTAGGAATELWAVSNQSFTSKAVAAEFSGTTITAHVTDGSEFDSGGSPGGFLPPPDGAVGAFLTPVTPDHTPPTITCPSPAPVFALQQSPASMTATVTDTGSGVVIPPVFPPPLPGQTAPPPFTQNVNTFLPGPGSVTFTASDRAGNTATATCSYTVIDDGDGVPPSIENGDGNGDGIADAIQPNVAVASAFTLPPLDPVVIATPTGTQLSFVGLQSSLFYGSPSGQTLQTGIVSAQIGGLVAGQTISVDVIPTLAGGNRFWAYAGSGWVALPSTVAGSRITFIISDGGPGDGDGSVNGSIYLTGAVTTSETTPPTITCGATPTFRQFQPFATVNATVADGESGVAFPFLFLPADTSVLGTHSVTFVAYDLAGNQGTQSCDYIVSDDGDGVPAAIEDAAPNNGDGNADGVLDSQQSNVASLPQPIGGGYTTIVSVFGDPLTDVSASDFAGLPPAPSGMHLDSGLYRFTVQASNAWVSLLRSPATNDNIVASPTGGTWQPVSSSISDGGFGDADGQFDGRVSYAIAPALVDSTPPTVTCPSAPSFLLRQPGATLTASLTDDESGVASGAVTVPVSTTSLGAKAAVVTASDLAGNTASVACPYNVGVRLDRIISPNPAFTTVVKATRPVPIRWRVVDFYGTGVANPAHFVGVNVTSTSCVKGRSTELDAVRGHGLRYLGAGRWELDWTPPSTKGCYTLEVVLTGASQTFRFKVT